jgi:tetratricopeptide (TPR) repeat protein
MPKKKTLGKAKASAGGQAGKKSSAPPANPQPVADRRALEKVSSDITRLLAEQSFETMEEANEFISQFVGTKDIPLPERELTSLEQAQDRMYEAWEARSRKARVRLAREALDISPDCADAYVLLAEEAARTPDEVLKRYEEGMRAGERALGPEAFAEGAGNFWGILETRPYMRARAGVAECLWEMGEVARAVEHYQELLRLNPGDNQGNRYPLARLLLQEGKNEELGALLKEYEEEALAEWLYTRALWLFRSEGASPRASRTLQEAFDGNRFVPIFLLDLQPLPDDPPEYISPGEESEAVDYLLNNGDYWADTPGAFEWFVGQFKTAIGELEKRVRAEENALKLRLLMGH